MSKVLGTTTTLKSTFTPLPLFYLRTSSSHSLFPSSIRKRNGRSDSIRPKGQKGNHESDMGWLGFAGGPSRRGARTGQRAGAGLPVNLAPALIL